MRYYETWKSCKRKREELLPQIRDELRVMEHPNGIQIFKRVEAKPLEWWSKKETAKDVVKDENTI